MKFVYLFTRSQSLNYNYLMGSIPFSLRFVLSSHTSSPRSSELRTFQHSIINLPLLNSISTLTMAVQGESIPLLVHPLASRPERRARGKKTTQQAPRPSSLGALSRLPAEIVFEILKHLDVRTLLRLRAVNYAVWDFVENCRPYERLMQRAKNNLIIMSFIGSLNLFAVEELDEAHHQPANCCYCSKPGNLLALKTATRCCIDCLYGTVNGEFGYEGQHSIRATGIRPSQLRDQPVFWLGYI